MYKFLLGLVIVIAVGAGGYVVWSSNSGDDLANLSANASAKLTDSQVSRIVERIGKFMVLPENETPTVVVVHDAESAQQQAFYQGVKNGDVLVVYSKTAILYDPVHNKLLNVSPLSRAEATPQASVTPDVAASGSPSVSPAVSATPATPEKVIVDVRNGTSTPGLAGSTANELKKFSWVTIGSLGDAVGAYKATVLVDLSKGKKPGAVAEIAKKLNVSAVTELPKGEKSTSADILVIVGK
jgi:uncharacterized protein (UPF0333 family)